MRRASRQPACGQVRARSARWGSWRQSFAEVLSGEVDEDGLERGLGDGEVGDLEAVTLGDAEHEREDPGLRLHLDDDGGVDTRGLLRARHVFLENLRQR